MKGLSNSGFVTNIYIGLSYYLFWIVFIFISTFENRSNTINAVMSYTWQLLYIIFLNFLLHQFFVPYIRSKKRIVAWMLLLTTIIFIIIIFGFYGWNPLGKMLLATWEIEPVSTTFKGFTVYLMFALFGLAYFAAIRFAIDSIKLNLNNQQLIIEKRQSELNYLKSQTNPHFLFNTLNSIYSLSLDQSEKTSGTVLRLSEILRYMLYEADASLVEISKEVQVVYEYIELEKIRYDSSLQVKVEVDIENNKQKIPPLLMMPIVENAFKHGISETIDQHYINIKLTCRENIFLFSVKNSNNSMHQNEKIKENIGLTNLRKQLQIQFADYKLNIENNKDSFIVNLYIHLSSYEKNKMYYN